MANDPAEGTPVFCGPDSPEKGTEMKTIDKKPLLLRIQAVVLIFALWLSAIVAVQLLFARTGNYLEVRQSSSAPGRFLLQGIACSAFPLLLLVFCAARMKEDFAGEMFFRLRGKSCRLWTVLLSLVLLGMTAYGLAVKRDGTAVLCGLVYYLAFVAFPEEFVSRDVCTHLLRREAGQVRYLIPNVLFALMHVFNYTGLFLLYPEGLGRFLLAFPSLLAIGCLMQYLKEKTGTIWIPVLLHAIIDYRFVFSLASK